MLYLSSGYVPVYHDLNVIITISVKLTRVERDMEQLQIEPNVNIRLSDLKLILGPELKIIYPLILDFTVSGDLELNGMAHPNCIKPKGILALENGEVGLGAPQVCLMLYFVLPGYLVFGLACELPEFVSCAISFIQL